MPAEIIIERIAGFDLFTIDKQGVGPWEGIAVLVEVAKQRQPAVFQRGAAIFIRALKSGDIVVDQF